jgi:hypothetical protein
MFMMWKENCFSTGFPLLDCFSRLLRANTTPFDFQLRRDQLTVRVVSTPEASIM